MTQITQQSGVALADMNPAQLGEATTALRTARQQYDRLSGICATLEGLVLLEAKRKLAHGKWMPWIEKHYGKSHRDANRLMRLGEQFISRITNKKTPEGKLDRSVQFEAQQLLLSDLTTSLAAIDAVKLDMDNPIVQTVATYVDGRSYNQLLMDLPPVRAGGDITPRDEQGKRIARRKRTKEEIEREQYEALASVRCMQAIEILGEVNIVTGPDGEHACRVLQPADLAKLKERAYDLYRACLDAEKRRAAGGWKEAAA